MNKKNIFIGFLLLFFIVGFKPVVNKEDVFSQATQIRSFLPRENSKPLVLELSSLPEKEKFVYKAKFLGLSIGTFIIMNNGKRELNGKEVYCFELTVKTPAFFSLLFKPKDRYVSYMDAKDLVVIRHEEYIKKGELIESAVDFDYKDLTATYKNFINLKESTVKIPTKLLDGLSGIFYIRMMPLELGDTVDLNIYADQIIYNYVGLVSSKTKVTLPIYGKKDAYHFKPYLFLEGKQVKKISAEAFFSGSIPSKVLRATLKTILGKVNVILVEGYE